MSDSATPPRRSVIRRKPLQAAKVTGILLAVVLAVAGFFRLIDAGGLAGPMLGDGQFLALLGLPLVSLGLVAVVTAETLVSGYRSLRSDRSVSEQVAARPGYLLLRAVEAGLAVLGVVIMASAVPVLLAESTPAPAGVGIMLLFFVVGLGILFASFVRSAAELVVYGSG